MAVCRHTAMLFSHAKVLIVSSALTLLLLTDVKAHETNQQNQPSMLDTIVEQLCVQNIIDRIERMEDVPAARWREALRSLSVEHKHQRRADASYERIYEILGSIGACREMSHLPCPEVSSPCHPSHYTFW